ncbi:MAG: hypothetical protein HYZ11_14535 [Candidatus Tectomicrobia bacterium]|uniref:Uncharacterized protein n=1 Tax=Tectimicrobiota bacterium TaxID=2528274 RepID=A0A932HZX1_UNCTE|nr:hypothetical protein [Candidatus Tectomicrobia bacterium]
MAIQCWMCSEILVEGKELASARTEVPKGRSIPVLSGCCPDCMGIVTEGALRSMSARNELTAA